FSGQALDNNNGVGVGANSTIFTLRRDGDSFYWTGSAWQASPFYLATTHVAQQGNQPSNWTSNATMPAWGSQADGVYTVQAIATDLVGNSFAGTAISFTLDNTTPSPINIGTVDSEDSLVTTIAVSATVPLGETVFVTVAMDPSTSNVSVTD